MPKQPTKGLGTLGPGIEVPLELHLAMRLHRIHNHFEGPMQLEIDLMGGKNMAYEHTWQLTGSQGAEGATQLNEAHHYTPAS